MTKLRKQTHLKANLLQEKMLLAGLGSVRIEKNCDLGIENAACGLGSITSRCSGKEPTLLPRTTRVSGGNRAYLRPRTAQDRGHSFSLYGPPSRPITYRVFSLSRNEK